MISSLEGNIRNLTENPEVPLENLAITVARLVREDSTMSPVDKGKLLGIIRGWSEYVRDHQIDSDNLFMLRWHIQRFARDKFVVNENHERLEIISEPVDSLVLPSGQRYVDYINSIAGEKQDVIHNSKLAIFGGSARIALKILAAEKGGWNHSRSEELISTELPISDLDIIAEISPEEMGNPVADITGTRVAIDIRREIENILRDCDFTMNQSLVYDGQLYYQKGALADARDGILCFTAKQDPLFGSESEILADGKRYINRRGLYRAFSFLLRRKASVFPIYSDNLKVEVPNMKRYWIVLLFVKLLSIQDIGRRNQAVSGWFNLAKNLGVTFVGAPKDFLISLLKENPEMAQSANWHGLSGREMMEMQVRWLAGKLMHRAIDVAGGRSEVRPAGMADNITTINEEYFGGPTCSQSHLDDLYEFVKNMKK